MRATIRKRGGPIRMPVPLGSHDDGDVEKSAATGNFLQIWASFPPTQMGRIIGNAPIFLANLAGREVGQARPQALSPRIYRSSSIARPLYWHISCNHSL